MNGNLVGFGMFVFAAVIIATGSLLLKLPNAPVMIAAGTVLVIIDMVLRLTKIKNAGWIWRQEFGGYLFFAPVWIFGLIVVAANLIQLYAGKK